MEHLSLLPSIDERRHHTVHLEKLLAVEPHHHSCVFQGQVTGPMCCPMKIKCLVHLVWSADITTL